MLEKKKKAIRRLACKLKTILKVFLDIINFKESCIQKT